MFATIKKIVSSPRMIASLASVPFVKKGYSSFKEEFYNNYMHHKTHIKQIEKLQVPDLEYGDMKLNVLPFEHTGEYIKLPNGFETWNDCFNEVLKKIPLQDGANTHYITIDSKYFQKDEFQRREGIHIDGNFCMDPYFVYQNYFLHFLNQSDSQNNFSLQNPFGMATWGGMRLSTSKASKERGKVIYSRNLLTTTWGGMYLYKQYIDEGIQPPIDVDVFKHDIAKSKKRDDERAELDRKKLKRLEEVVAKRKKRDDERQELDRKKLKSLEEVVAENESGREKLGSQFPINLRPLEIPSLMSDKFETLESLIGFCYNYRAKKDNSHVTMSWKLPCNIVVPVGTYVSENKGGILTASNQVGCQAWEGEYYGRVLSEGDYSDMANQLTDKNKTVFEKNTLYFMTSNTPHETLLQKADTRRSFLRITLNHNYDNSVFKKKT